MEFFDWNMLGEYTGAVLAVNVFTQITKGLPGVRRLPTQLWSYMIAFLTLMLAMVFGPGFTAEGAVLAVFNAAVVSLAANGGFSAMERIKTGLNEAGQ